MLQWLYMYVAKVCYQCFICVFGRMLKCVYLDVAYISHICCMCFIWMLHMFAKVFKCFQEKNFKCFRNMLQVCVSNVSIVFGHML
jgi:hypothetical protein